MMEFFRMWKEKEETVNKFYLYHQNNSGGSFDIDDSVDVNVIIEATSERNANRIAKEIGIYFNGVDKGWDCNCCGDRWSEYPDEYNTIMGATNGVYSEWGGTIIYMANGEVYKTNENER